MMHTKDRNSARATSAIGIKRSFLILLPVMMLVFITGVGVVLRACISTHAETVANDGGMGTLAGTVFTPQGKAAVDASVTMQNADGQLPHATTTNKDGRFFFPDLPHGYYDVRASTPTSRSEWKHNLEIVAGKQTEVTLRLAPKPH
jgi:hypothetical protein